MRCQLSAGFRRTQMSEGVAAPHPNATSRGSECYVDSGGAGFGRAAPSILTRKNSPMALEKTVKGRFTVDDIKRETARAFKPLRCEVQDFDYDSGFEFSVFDAEDPALVYMGKLRTSQYQDPKALAEVFRRWLIVVAAKGHELAPWTPPS